MRCPVCENKILKAWKHCPECGIKIAEGKLKHEGYSIERIRSRWVQKGGENFYQNFQSVEHVGTIPYTKIKPIRPILGDFVHIHASNMKTMSLLSLQPNCAKEIAEVCRLIGYYSADYALKTMRLSKIVDMFSKTGLYWKVLSNKELQKALYDGWAGTHEAIVKVHEMDPNGKHITFEVEEDMAFYLKASKPVSIVDLNILAGQLEALYNKKCIGEEKTINGKKYFKYRLLDQKDRTEYPTTILEKGEYDDILDDLVCKIINKKPSGRKKLEDKVHISGEQVAAYFTIQASEGHRILEKYSGVKVGKRLIQKTGIKTSEKALEYLQKMLKENGICIMKIRQDTPEKTILTIEESAYSSGVKNINMRLDTFIEGLIEGMLNEATGGRWHVEEMECIANGNLHCEFRAASV